MNIAALALLLFTQGLSAEDALKRMKVADGFDVVVNGRENRAACDETAAAVAATGRQALVAMGDMGLAEDCRRVAGEGIARFGRIDVLVHNAAIRPSVPFLEIDEAEWRRVMDALSERPSVSEYI